MNGIEQNRAASLLIFYYLIFLIRITKYDDVKSCCSIELKKTPSNVSVHVRSNSLNSFCFWYRGFSARHRIKCVCRISNVYEQ